MTPSSDLDSFVDHLQDLLVLLRHQDVLSTIERLAVTGTHTSSILRLKSRAQAGIGDTESAFATLRQLVIRGDDTPDDLYWAGQYAAELAHYEEAENLLSLSIDKAKATKEHYYLNCALLLRAYVRTHLRKFSAAGDDLKELDDDMRINWSDRLGVVTKTALLRHVSTAD
jgi:hypothetical protein